MVDKQKLGPPREDRLTDFTGPADDPKITGFQLPGGVPVEVPLVVPIPPAPTQPTIPVKMRPNSPIKPARDFSRIIRQMEAKARKSRIAAAEAERLKKLKLQKLARAGPWVLGFQIGWELGDYLWPNGWYDFATPDPGDFAGYTFPSNWINTCNSGGGADLWRSGGQIVFTEGGHSTSSGNVGTNSNCGSATAKYKVGDLQPSFGISSNNFTQVSSFEYDGEVFPATTNIKWYKVTATWEKRFGSTGPQPEVEYVPGTGTPAGTPMPQIKRAPSEMPEVFPMSQPMEMPYPQPWKTALPEPYSQGEGKHNYGVGAQVTYPRLPLAPFPIVSVIPPPGGTVPPPPDQVIDIPPPPFTEGPYPVKPGNPPTFHTRPPQGRKRPDRGTKEKKLSVRSVANKAWIVLNLATEGFDFIDALFDALPKECQDKAKASIDYGAKGGGRADPYSKSKAIYDCFDHLDWDKFVNNFINMQLTDMAVGMIGMTAGKYLKLTGQATGSGGLASKPTATAEKALDDYLEKQVAEGNMTKEEADEIKASAKLPIPQVEYQDGQWVVHIPAWGLTFG